jgi:DNA-binding NtrC family response regulator/tetratricopeptide (TPR) repeat protein
MQLVADRFALDDTGIAIDLATGARVMLVVEAAGDLPQQLQWNERCETLHTIRHPALAPLVDFGLTGAASRFEAWRCGPAWRGAPDAARAIRERAMRFLRAMHLSVGADHHAGVRVSRRGMGLWLPDTGTGYPVDGDDTETLLPLVEHGLRLIDRPAVAALADAVRTQSGSRSPVASLWGARESGKRSALAAIAREARLAGFVPVAIELVGSAFAPLWHGRSVLLIAAGAASPPWSALLRMSLQTAQPHVLLVVAETECRGVDGVPLRVLSSDALVGAVRPRVSGQLETAARRAADHAHGLPGRFARRIWRQALDTRSCHVASRRTPRVAEQPADYGEADVAASPLVTTSPAVISSWPLPGELATLRRKIDAGAALVAAGRHASGMRELRQAVGGFARRGAWADATDAGMHLAAALLGRGRPADAQKIVEEAREYAAHVRGDARLVELATISGDAWIDRARLDEAEGILATAVSAARMSNDSACHGASLIAMGRCLLWRGRYAEAAASLERCPAGMPQRLQVRRAATAARVALALGDLGAAMREATCAIGVASAPSHAGLQANALYTRAFVHLAAGDFEAADRELAAVLDAARRARDPLRAIRARLLRAESERRRGRTAAAAAQVARIRRAIAGAPPLLRARWQLASALCARGDTSASSILERHIAGSGLGGMAIYAAACEAASPAALSGGDPFLEHIVSILRVCQTAEDDSVVLKDVCIRVRQHLHAASVAFVGVRDGQSRAIAVDGPRSESDIAERAVAAATTIAPHRREDRVEAAAPVMYGGTPIAALCARWTLGSTYGTPLAGPALTMTAAAAAPVVAMAIERRDQQTHAPDTGLLGVSPAMVELRRSAASAAAAPFPVLIDGESGSGKELVARAIHYKSTRRQRPFCALNCAALPEDLVEAELFGHARGSFTGAVIDRAGVFEEAHGGTLFLDEIGELSPRAQSKVLRVIQEGELRRVGDTASRRVDVRIISATNRNLRQEVEVGRFRLDLLYRLDVVHIAVPALRERREDVALLAEHFWRDAASRVGSRATLGAATLAVLARYDWPGNVRELQNVLAALAVRCPKRGVVPATALPHGLTKAAPAEGSRLDDARRTFEERFVRAALVRTGGHRGRAAEELGVTRQGLTKLMTRLGISP